jgi:predicted Ser/Thr protein kinase
MDIDKITERVKESIQKFNLIKDMNEIKDIEPSSNLYSPLFPFVNHVIENVLIENTSYWADTGIRIESTEDYMDCMKKIRLKEIGRGSFGIVYKVFVNKCIKHVPKNVKVVAIKVEHLNTMYLNPSQIKTSIAIIQKAAKLGITPQLFDVFLVKMKDKFLLIKVYEYIEGSSWNESKFTKQSYENALEQLNQAIHIMNTNGIIHHDLHTENVMITKNKVYIIDFDLAQFAKEDEKNLLPMFYKSEFTLNENKLRSIYVFNDLVKKNVTRKNISKKHEYKKKTKSK